MKFKNTVFSIIATLLAASYSVSALAATEVQWWHAMGGVNGERVNKIADDVLPAEREPLTRHRRLQHHGIVIKAQPGTGRHLPHTVMGKPLAPGGTNTNRFLQVDQSLVQ